jgi:small ligand-binding sensory domain FIST
MAYMRMQESKFWGWVITSLIIGLGVGLLAMYFWAQMATAKKIDAARTELSSQVADANAKVGALETRLASSEASTAALAEANSQLTAEIDTAKTEAKKTTSNASSSLTVVSREIQPDLVDPSDTITMTAKVKGSPEMVTMRIKAKSGSYDETFTLEKVSTSGSTQTWRSTAKAPSKSGDYTYYATATSGDTKVTMEGASPSTLTVR